MGSRQITRPPSPFGVPRTWPAFHLPPLTGWPRSGRSWPIPARAWSLAAIRQTGTYWPSHWLNPAAPSRAQERSSPVTATYLWSSCTPTCGDKVSAAKCCRDCTSVPWQRAGTVRPRGPGRQTRALDACTNARDTGPQATRPRLETVSPFSRWSVKLTDRRRSLEDPWALAVAAAAGTGLPARGVLSRTLVGG